MKNKTFHNEYLKFENSLLVLVKDDTDKTIAHYTLFNEYMQRGKVKHYKRYNHNKAVLL